MFITLEGPEGSGKTTAVESAVKRLQELGYEIVRTREPGGTPIAEQIRNVILDKANTAMDPRTEALLYAASRRQHLVEKVWPAIKEGKIVVCDRYLDSSLAYQGGARGLGVDNILNINLFATENTWPDLTLLFDIDPKIGLERIIILSAAGDKGVAFHVAALVDHERRHSDTALRAGDGARAASIDYSNLHVSIQSVNALAEFLPAVNFFTEAQSLFVGVTAIIHQHFFAGICIGALCRLGCGKLFVERFQLRLQSCHARLCHAEHILLRHAPHLRKYIGKGARIAFGIAQHRTALTAVIRTHRKHVTVDCDLAGICSGMGIACSRQNRHQAHQAKNCRARKKIAEQNLTQKLFHFLPLISQLCGA